MWKNRIQCIMDWVVLDGIRDSKSTIAEGRQCMDEVSCRCGDQSIRIFPSAGAYFFSKIRSKSFSETEKGKGQRRKHETHLRKWGM